MASILLTEPLDWPISSAFKHGFRHHFFWCPILAQNSRSSPRCIYQSAHLKSPIGLSNWHLTLLSKTKFLGWRSSWVVRHVLSMGGPCISSLASPQSKSESLLFTLTLYCQDITISLLQDLRQNLAPDFSFLPWIQATSQYCWLCVQGSSKNEYPGATSPLCYPPNCLPGHCVTNHLQVLTPSFLGLLLT